MLTLTRSFTTLILLLALAGCDLFTVGYGGLPTELDNPPADDDDSRPGDDDDASDDDDSDVEPDGAPCFGRDITENDFDCDGIPEEDANGNRVDIVTTNPGAPDVGFHRSTISGGGVLRYVGEGEGGAFDWLFANGFAAVLVGSWYVGVPTEIGPHRSNLLSSLGEWSDIHNYCEDGVELSDGGWVRDPGCVYDEGCAFDDYATAGWAYAYVVRPGYTRRMTSTEKATRLHLSQDECAELEAAAN